MKAFTLGLIFLTLVLLTHETLAKRPTCPSFDEIVGRRACNLFVRRNRDSFCRRNSECDDDSRCCAGPCDKKWCQGCPVVRPWPRKRCMTAKFARCESTRECPSGQMCCKGVCPGTQYCQDAVSQ